MTSDGRYIGKIKTIGEDRGFGFIDCDATYAEYEKDIFVPRALLGNAEEGTEVTFLVQETEDGKPRATDIQIDGVPTAEPRKAKGKGGKDKGGKGGKGKGKDKGKDKGKGEAPVAVPAKVVPAKDGFVPCIVPPKTGMPVPIPAKVGHIPVQVPPPAKAPMLPGSMMILPPKAGMMPQMMPPAGGPFGLPKAPVTPGVVPPMDIPGGAPSIPIELMAASTKAKMSAPDPSSMAAVDALPSKAKMPAPEPVPAV